MPSSSSRFPPAGVDPFLSEHDATWRDALHRLEAYSPSCLEGVFCELRVDGVLVSSSKKHRGRAKRLPTRENAHLARKYPLGILAGLSAPPIFRSDIHDKGKPAARRGRKA
jgi:hypothetical protein